MKKLTVFYTHGGAQSYLKTSLYFSSKRLKDCDFVLLGDESNKNFWPKWENMKNLESDMSKRFTKHYKHMSTNMYGYEFFCFIRWFYILEYMRKNKIERGCYMDSDILFLEIPNFVLEKDYYFTGESGGLSFFTYKELEKLCKFMLSYYEDKDKLEELTNEYNSIRKNYLFGGISDMTLISKFGYLNGYEDALGIRNMSTFDHNINCEDQFEFNRGSKSVYYKNGNFYFKNYQSRLLIKCNTLHFQGDAKDYMKDFKIDDLDKNILYIFDYETRKWVDADQYIVKRKKSFKMNVKQFCYKIAKRIDTYRTLKKKKR